jgi:hypothetical protein
MAVVRANYVKRGKGERKTAKANIRYIQQRPGRDKEKLTRVLFGSAGMMGRYEAYQFIDAEAKQGRYFYRLKLSPDPIGEDTKRDLNMQKLTRQMMQRLEKRLQTRIPWAAALHDDHTNIRHVHILAAIPRRLRTPELETLISEATVLCREQRRGLDRTADRQIVIARRVHWQGRVEHQTTKHFVKTHTQTYRRDKPPPPMLQGVRPAPTHASCTCPRCHFSQTHNRQNGIHSCVSCGQMLHKKKALSLQQRKEREWERSL